MDHPPQVSHTGELTLENVALRLLGRLARENKMYIVLGSVEERVDGSANGRYDTTVVINKSGEVCYTYRKRRVSSMHKLAGEKAGIFNTEFGPIGILLSAELEDHELCGELLDQKPYLLLNPACSPSAQDPFLLQKYPNLQIRSWHAEMARLDKLF